MTLTGTSEAGSEVWVYGGETRIGTAIADADGTWAIAGAGDANAIHSYGAIAWDQARNFGESPSNYSAPAPSQDSGAEATVELVGITPVD